MICTLVDRKRTANHIFTNSALRVSTTMFLQFLPATFTIACHVFSPLSGGAGCGQCGEESEAHQGVGNGERDPSMPRGDLSVVTQVTRRVASTQAEGQRHKTERKKPLKDKRCTPPTVRLKQCNRTEYPLAGLSKYNIDTPQFYIW